jgi:hypothetical protein
LSSSSEEEEEEDDDDEDVDDDESDEDELGKVDNDNDNQDDEDEEEDSDAEDDDEDNLDEFDVAARLRRSPLSAIPEARRRPIAHVITTTLRVMTAEATFSLEAMSDGEYDVMDNSDFETLDVLRPSGYEYPDSDRSRSHTRPVLEVDPQVMRDFQGLNCIDSSESEFDSNEDEAEVTAAIRQRRVERRHRRMTSGSISKRTVSDRGSDSDREDLQPWDHGEAGPNPRRIRRKTERFSWMSSATTHDIIYELKEPNSDAEASVDESGTLARELPYYLYMDVDSE